MHIYFKFYARLNCELQLSLKPYQKEVLIMPDTAFEVIDIQKQGNELWVKMTEK